MGVPVELIHFIFTSMLIANIRWYMLRSHIDAKQRGLKIIEKQIWCYLGDYLQGLFLENGFQKKNVLV